MADDNLQALKSFKEKFKDIWLAFNPNQTARFSTDEPSAIDPKFIEALSATVGTIQKRLLDNDRAFLKKFNPANSPEAKAGLDNTAEKITSQFGVLGLPGKDTGELVNALMKSHLLKKPEFSGDKAFLEQASKIYNEFIKLPENLQITINAELAPIPSPIIESAPPPSGNIKSGGTSSTATPHPAKPRPEEKVPPWLAYPVKNPFFEERDYALMLENPRNEAALKNLAQEALMRFVARAVEDGVAREIPRPSSYPAKGVMGITTEGVTKYYDTSHISEAMFGLYKKDGKTVHFKPDYRDLELAFEGLPLKGATIELPNIPIYQEEIKRTNFDSHKYGEHTFFHNRVWAHFFGEINDFPEADRNRILYRLGHRLEELNSRNPFFKTLSYDIELDKAQREGKVNAFMTEMEGLALRNASPFAYYRLGTAVPDDPDNLRKEYEVSQKDYIRQRQETLYKRDRGITDAPAKKDDDCKKVSLNETFNQNTLVASVEEVETSPATIQEKFRDNADDANLTPKPEATTDSPGAKSPALKNPVITV